MPKREIDFSKGLIYKIVCRDVEVKDLYVGSTTNFSKRKGGHKSSCKNQNDANYNLPLYKTIREKGGFDAWDMILIENYPCENNNELHSRERHYMEQLHANLNSRAALRTSQEKKQYQKEFDKAYREENREKLNEDDRNRWNERKEQQNQNRRETIFECECGSQCRVNGKARHERTNKHKKLIE